MTKNLCKPLESESSDCSLIWPSSTPLAYTTLMSLSHSLMEYLKSSSTDSVWKSMPIIEKDVFVLCQKVRNLRKLQLGPFAIMPVTSALWQVRCSIEFVNSLDMIHDEIEMMFKELLCMLNVLKDGVGCHEINPHEFQRLWRILSDSANQHILGMVSTLFNHALSHT